MHNTQSDKAQRSIIHNVKYFVSIWSTVRILAELGSMNRLQKIAPLRVSSFENKKSFSDLDTLLTVGAKKLSDMSGEQQSEFP